MTNEAKELLKREPELCKEILYVFMRYYDKIQGNCGELGKSIWEKYIKEHTANDWEILSFKHQDGTVTTSSLKDCHKWPHLTESFTTEDALELGTRISIHSVRRLSDNEVFTVGDVVNRGKITKFSPKEFWAGGMCVETDHKNETSILSLTKRTPLFTTEDGKPVYPGNKYYFVTPFMDIYKTTATDCTLAENRKFSTREAAEQWVEDNKPIASINQLREWGLSEDTIQNLKNK